MGASGVIFSQVERYGRISEGFTGLKPQRVVYRKIPVISPGLIQLFVRGFGWAYKRRGLYPWEGLINGIKKNVSKRETAALIKIRF